MERRLDKDMKKNKYVVDKYVRNNVLCLEKSLVLQQYFGVDTEKATAYFLNIKYCKEDPFSERWELHFKSERSSPIIARVKYVSTFTLADILDMLPNHIVINDVVHRLSINRSTRYYDTWCISYTDPYCISFHEHHLIDAAYSMLIWLVQRGMLNKKEEK